MHIARTFAVATTTVVLSLGSFQAAQAVHAGKPGSEPCAKETAQVAKAQAALAHATAVFAAQHTPEAKKAKKAQKQRLLKAEQRLADCQAAQTAA